MLIHQICPLIHFFIIIDLLGGGFQNEVQHFVID
jgi:hypothetical protein